MSVTKTRTPGKLDGSQKRNNMSQSRMIGRSGGQGQSSGIRASSGISDLVSRKLRVPVHLMDSEGNDLTPVSLLDDDKRSKDTDKDGNDPSHSNLQPGTIGNSSDGASPFAMTKSHMSGVGSVYSGGDAASVLSEDAIDMSNLQQATEYTEVKTAEDGKNEESPSEQKLTEMICINIAETETFDMLYLPVVCLVSDSEEGKAVEIRNAKYQDLIKSRTGNDRFVPKGMNTFNNPHLNKVQQTADIETDEMGINVTTWEMYDTYQEILEKEAKELMESGGGAGDDEGSPPQEEAGEATEEGGRTSQAKSMSSSQSQGNADKGGGGVNETIASSADSDVFGTKNSVSSMDLLNATLSKEELLFKSATFGHTLFIMERALNLNTYQEKLALYRNLPTVENIMLRYTEEEPVARTNRQPHLETLWSFSSSKVTRGRNVTRIAINKQNPDVLAVAYGQYEFSKQLPGLVCCWTLKNNEHPERVYHLKAGVNSVDWSRMHPNLLAAGCYDGLIYIFDVRQTVAEAVIDTKESPGRHLGPVRQVQWVCRDSGRSAGGEQRTEVLISTSTDGRITQWSIRKGLESTDLMKLKRISTNVPGASKQSKSDALISRFDGGVSIAFNSNDTNIYLAGTESGHVHRCSCSYNEQYLESYFGHTAPAYSIQWSPFASDVFLSCAADWTIKLWMTDRPTPVINFQSSTKSVNSICWSPRSSVVFASVNDGSVEVWNLKVSTLDPIVVDKMVQETIVATCVQFAQNSESLFVGDSVGNVTVYKLNCMPETPRNQAETLDKVLQSSIASQLPK